MNEILDAGICRLIPLSAEHKARYIELANDPLIRVSMNNPVPYEQKDFDELFESCRQHERHLTWMIEADGTICGALNTSAMAFPQRFQGGYWIDTLARKKGLATAALKRSNAYLWERFSDVVRLQALVEPDNHASIRVLEKAGYEREGLLRKSYPTRYRGLVDVCMYAIVKP